MSIVTRFAPSPTGFLHIGGARTALFNWLFARRHGGRYLLRIEDTDRERSTKAAVDAIIEGLSWLELDADAAPIFQSTRAERHQAVAMAMLDKGTAYRCYVPAAELEARRARGQALLAEAKTAESKGDGAGAAALRQAAAQDLAAYRSPYRDGARPEDRDAPFVVRLKAPLTGETLIADKVQGDVRFAHADLDDMILLRSDGAPTYMLAVVVDDHDMGVTHVIRGVDHLTNAGRQAQIVRAMEWDLPVYAHVPLIHGPDGAKLSKRHGALGVEAYRDLGYLPEALGNYLLRLGWAEGDQEILSRREAIDHFSLEGIGRSPARLDFTKMDAVNAHYLREAADERLADLSLPLLNAPAPREREAVRASLIRAMPAMKLRAKTLVDLAAQAGFLTLARPLPLDDKARTLLAPAETRARLARFGQALATTEWALAPLERMLKEFVAQEGIGFGAFGPALRASLTGGAASPDLAATLYALGAEESLKRIADHTHITV